MHFPRQHLLLLLLIFLLPAAAAPADGNGGEWPTFRGPNSDASLSTGLLKDLEDASLHLVWKRPLGMGYSGVSVADGRAVTLFSDGKTDFATALDANSGRELWRVAIDSTYAGHDGSHTGPISTPAIADGRVFGLGPRGILFALDLENGTKLWSTHLVADFGAAEPDYGFSTSPLLLDGVLVVEFAGEDGESAISGFDPASGQRVWHSGAGKVNYQSPAVVELAGRKQVVAVVDTSLYGIEAGSGQALWQYVHHGSGADIMHTVPVGANRLFLDYSGERTAVIELGHADSVATRIWSSRALGGSYSIAVYYQDHLYGYSNRFLTCVDANNGKSLWKSRQPGDGFPLLVDGHLIIITKKGGLHVAKASPEGYRELAGLKLFEDHCWSPPSFAGDRIYVRSQGEIAALALRRGGATAHFEYGAGRAPAGSRLAAFLARLEAAADKGPVIDTFMDSIPSFPLLEGRDLVHFFYRGPADDMGIASDFIGERSEEPMQRAAGTDLFYYTARLEPDARFNYRFIRNFEESLLDSLNPRRTPTIRSGEMSWCSMPAWEEALHLRDPPEAVQSRLDSVRLESAHFEESRRLDIYLPASYEDSGKSYPVAYVHWSDLALERGHMVQTLDNLIDRQIEPLIAVFIHPALRSGAWGSAEFVWDRKDDYAAFFAEELVPYIDRHYRTSAAPQTRASIGMGFAGYSAFYIALKNPGLVGKISGQSLFMMDTQEQQLRALVPSAGEQPLQLYLEWGKYDARGSFEGWDMAAKTRNFAGLLQERGYSFAGGEVHDGFSWASWRNRTDAVLAALFPLAPQKE
jgi:outer membrane protein assembly factor BamB